MAGTIIRYLKKECGEPFTKKRFNAVDSLALCQLSYLKFRGILPKITEDRFITLQELSHSDQVDALFADKRYEKPNRELFFAMARSRRFATMRLCCFADIKAEIVETQFSAVTYLLEDGHIYLAFRGTDETLIGWKEDFNMMFLDPIPGQDFSVIYLEQVAKRFPKGTIFLGGHSKGGNLAVYAAMNARPDIKKRLCAVYSMDGPGFREEVLRRCHYEEIENKIIKIVPQASIVGRMFGPGTGYRIIKSKKTGFRQHNAYYWKVKGYRFCYASGRVKPRGRFNETFHRWILSKTEQQRQELVDSVYRMITENQKRVLLRVVLQSLWLIVLEERKGGKSIHEQKRSKRTEKTISKG